jgi:hypothetical protein
LSDLSLNSPDCVKLESKPYLEYVNQLNIPPYNYTLTVNIICKVRLYLIITISKCKINSWQLSQCETSILITFIRQVMAMHKRKKRIPALLFESAKPAANVSAAVNPQIFAAE